MKRVICFSDLNKIIITIFLSSTSLLFFLQNNLKTFIDFFHFGLISYALRIWTLASKVWNNLNSTAVFILWTILI